MDSNSSNSNQLPAILALSFIVLVAAIGAFLILQNQNNNSQNSNNSVNNTTTATVTPTSQSNTNSGTAGKYTNYENSLVAADKTNILFFYASWCPTCNALEADLNASLADIPEDVNILKVPYDDITGATSEHIELKNKYNVTYQHTLVQVDENLNQIKKWSGSGSLESLLAQAQ